MNWSYITGFFDGEGSISNNGKGFRITMPQTNKEVLDKIQNFVGFGYVIKVRKRKSHWKDSWVYYIAKQQDIYEFLVNVSRFLVVKRKLTAYIIPQLKNILEQQHKRKIRLQRRIKEGKKLRNEGLTYREIGKRLNIDWGYARRLILKH